MNALIQAHTNMFLAGTPAQFGLPVLRAGCRRKGQMFHPAQFSVSYGAPGPAAVFPTGGGSSEFPVDEATCVAHLLPFSAIAPPTVT